MSPQFIDAARSLTRVLSAGFASVLVVVAVWLGTAAPAAALSSTQPVVAALFSFSGSRPMNLGVQNGQFSPCPTTPNCVSSQSQDQEHAIAPLRFTTEPAVAFDHLKETIQAQPRASIITATEGYIRAEFTSAIMGFVDDVEFYLDRSANVIQVRSASRLGESDLGVNRKRIETIRTRLAEPT